MTGTEVLVLDREFDDPKSAVIGTATGGQFHPLAPRLADIRLDDIAHALANICRYTGHVSEFWSVAAHCIEVSRLILAETGDARLALCGLLHDASEAYLVDVPRPLKPHFPGYRDREERLERTIAAAFDLPYPFPPIVKEIDSRMIPREVANFFPPDSFCWKRYGITMALSNLTPLDPKVGRVLYSATFAHLNNRRLVDVYA